MTLNKDGLEAAHAAYAKTTGGMLEGHPMANAITAYLAARPAPDHAGLASRVFYPVNNPSAWPDGFNQNISDLLREAATALSAASPAPLEGVTVTPIGYARSVDVDPKHRPMEGRNSFWCTQDQNAYYSVPVYLSAIVGSDEAATVIQTLQRENARLEGEAEAWAAQLHHAEYERDFNEKARANWKSRAEAAEQQVRDMSGQVEQAFRDGLAYGSNVEGADPETAWMQSRVRASLTKDQSNG